MYILFIDIFIYLFVYLFIFFVFFLYESLYLNFISFDCHWNFEVKTNQKFNIVTER